LSRRDFNSFTNAVTRSPLAAGALASSKLWYMTGFVS
jgi:hypothetical protein